jgi:hypothetical protein
MQAEVVELADALDSKSSGSNTMRVRFPPSAPDMTMTTEFWNKNPKLCFFSFDHQKTYYM